MIVVEETEKITKPKRESMTCTVHTKQQYMVVYVWLYIIGLVISMVAVIYGVLGNVPMFFDILLIAIGFFLIATIIWGIDRQCIPENTK